MDAGCAFMGLMLGLRAALMAVMPAPMPFMAPVPGDMPVMEGLMPVLTLMGKFKFGITSDC
ncbi:hypothetical protein EYF80_006674 [Liparis tanakae]|uniref:Uncharacterized protein n=1 Tax=Liparis tanakae TaxID=230148 RepID=A0A4Z2IZ87_9TELE|nr:hypothetical protein EYF80_006674 [Liparis tanakae]